MGTKQTQLFPPPTQSKAVSDEGYVSNPLRQWLFTLQNLLPLRLGDTSGGSYSENLPPAGLNASTGQSNQNQEIIYVKTSGDANTLTITGAATGGVVLSSQWEAVRFKSDGTNWYAVSVGSASAVLLETDGAPNSVQNLLDLVAGTNITLSEAGGHVTIDATGGGSLTANQISPREVWAIGDGKNPVFGIGDGDAPAATGTLSNNRSATATQLPFNRYSATAVASLNVVVGVRGPSQAVTGVYSVGVIQHYAMRFRYNQSANARFWWGLSGSPAIGGSPSYANDTPNTSYAAFRFSAGVDGHVMAACGPAPNPTSLQTIVDTGIAIDTVNSHLYEIVWTGSAFQFYIDTVLVATISTNIMAAGDLVSPFCSGDNKNTATAISLDFFWYRMNLLT